MHLLPLSVHHEVGVLQGLPNHCVTGCFNLYMLDEFLTSSVLAPLKTLSPILEIWPRHLFRNEGFLLTDIESPGERYFAQSMLV